MNYTQKRTLVGRVIYIVLTLSAIAVLCVTMFTFFGAKKNKKVPVETGTPAVTEKRTEEKKKDSTGGGEKKSETETKPVADSEPAAEPVTGEDRPVDGTVAEEPAVLRVLMPVEGMVYRSHSTTVPVFSVTMNDYRTHTGVDIACREGAIVTACADGRVKAAGYDSFMGYSVIVEHENGLVSTYRNLAEQFADGIRAGANVKAGQPLGTVSDSAVIEISDEPHLHFELTLHGESIDPMEVMEYKETVLTE